MATEIFGNISNKTTLGRSPFLSRFTEFESTDENYVFIGFTPGLALQAAELNEIQDNFHKVSTLNSILNANWTLYCIKKGTEALENIDSFLWDGVVPLSPSMVTISDNTVTFSSGWYYVTDPSGIKYWIYSSQSFTQSTIGVASGFIGFTISTVDYFAEGINADDRLFDNSAGIPNTNSPGSYRISRNFSGIQFVQATTNFDIIQKITNTFFWPNGIQI